ncbi:glycosylphosphatidylinositol anchor biosynthesis [Entomophthora muscae]|uniref:Glycosylphosphatidylinositol anchor biosynthesis n=1 Tax=Entomophthora muscae TaxID=34485 RepID=A0ACC2TQ89_9FUNG|nr:glycosylphosphatidylinositol anchor biosynthesis [Entomophthora muscae]
MLLQIALLYTLFRAVVGDDVDGLFKATTSNHTNNWAVLVSTSRFWFNYRHMSDTLALYRTVKRLGIPDSNIILMLADDVSCNPRNVFPGSVFQSVDHKLDLYGDDIEVDYRGYEVTVENFVRLLTGRLPADTPKSKRLQTDHRSNVLVYLAGHGGANFLKFQDAEEITADEIADSFEQMNQKKRYNELLFIIDTCEANTLYSKIYSKNIIAMGSSELGEKAYSYQNDYSVGLSLVDRYTHYTLEFMEKVRPGSKVTMKQLVNHYDANLLGSTPGVMAKNVDRPIDEMLVTDFFGSVQATRLTLATSKPLFANISTPQLSLPTAASLEIETTLFSQVTSYLSLLFFPPPGQATLVKLQHTNHLPHLPVYVAILLIAPFLYVFTL